MPALSISLFALLAAAQASPEKTAAPADPVDSEPRLGATRGGVTPTAAVRAVPERPLQSLIGTGDYPAAAIRARQEGRSSFRLAIGPDGRVTGCVVLGSSGSSALDAATCRIIRSRARFTPARDASGRLVSDDYFGEYVWRLPR
jgi:periplasmic protein TonB